MRLDPGKEGKTGQRIKFDDHIRVDAKILAYYNNGGYGLP